MDEQASSRVLRLFRYFLPFLLLLGLSFPASGAQPRIEAPAPLAELLKRHLRLEEPRDEIERELLLNRLRREGQELLATEGYFDPVLDLEGENLDALTLKVTPGPRALIQEVHILIDGPVPEERRQALQKAWSLQPGQPFRQADWNRAKDQLLMGLLEEDFAAARLTHSRANVDATQHQVTLEVTANSGPPYRFGPLKIDGLLRYTPELVERHNTQVEPGNAYQSGRLLGLQTTLENTPYFNSVFITLDQDEAVPGEDGSLTAPVQLSLRESAPHRLGMGIGASSNTGARAEVNFRTADLFNQAWQLNSGIRLEQLRQSAYADIFLPPTPGQYRHAFGVLIENSDIQNLKIETRSLGISRSHQRGSIDMTLALGYIQERNTPQGQRGVTERALTLNTIWSWHPFRNQPDLTQGFSSQIQVGGAFRPISDENFIRLYGRHQQTIALSSRNTLNFRAEGGIVLADSRKGVPETFLFRAGGTNSVRGYSYQSLGVRSGPATLGGRYLVTLGTEWTHWLADSPWGIATFVDAGNASDDLNDFKLKLGYGMGVRWRSPIGALGGDLAYGQDTGSWHFHFALSLPF